MSNMSLNGGQSSNQSNQSQPLLRPNMVSQQQSQPSQQRNMHQQQTRQQQMQQQMQQKQQIQQQQMQSRRQQPMMQTSQTRRPPAEGEGRHLSRRELATMSTLEQRLQGKRAGKPSMLDQYNQQKEQTAIFQYKKGAIEDEYEVGKDLGSGQFAVVKRLKHRKTGQTFAGKYIRKKKVKTSRKGIAQTEIEREISILNDLNHPRIVKLKESWQNANEVILVMELVSGGELFDYLADREQLTENEAAGIIKQVLETLDYMHDLKIAHFDLKPENIMCLPGKVPPGSAPAVKLIDFGLSQRCDLGIEVQAMHGTPEFVAPEVLAFEPVGLEADMWSIGVITYILLSGCSPFQGEDKAETFSRIAALDYEFDEEDFAGISHEAKQFIEQLFTRDPLKRATAKQCLHHDWVIKFSPKNMPAIKVEPVQDRREIMEMEKRKQWEEEEARRKAEASRAEMARRGQNGFGAQRNSDADETAPGLLRQLYHQRKNLENEIDDFKTKLVGQRTKHALQREPSNIRNDSRSYDTSVSISGSNYSLGQTRTQMASGLGRLESSMNSFETRRTDLRRMVRSTASTMDSVQRSMNSTMTRFSSINDDVRSRYGTSYGSSTLSSLRSGIPQSGRR